MKRAGHPYAKARPVPRKPATKEGREEFVGEANATLGEPMAKGHVVPCGGEAEVLRRNGGGYGRRRAGGRDAARTTFSWQSAKLFGALGRDGFYMRPADALNSETFISCLKGLRHIRTKFAMTLDNAGYRRYRMAVQFMESAGGDNRWMCLPPHTPSWARSRRSIWRSSARWPAGTLRAWTSSGTQLRKTR